jgi:hypothetical protein
MQKQLKWMLYTRENEAHLKAAMSCRFMRIERRLEDDKLTEKAYTIDLHEDFFVYRDCDETLVPDANWLMELWKGGAKTMSRWFSTYS